MSDDQPGRTPGLYEQASEFTANPRVRRAAGIGLKALAIWGVFVLLLVIVVFVFVGFVFFHIAG